MPFQPETAMSVSDEESTEEESTEEEDEPHQQESTAEEEEEEEPGPLSRLEQRRKRNCEEQGRYFDGLEVAKAAITPCTTDAAVPPEPAVAIEAPGEDLVAEVARLKAKSQNWRRRYEEETSHRGMADDKLVSLQERMDTLVSDLDASETIIQSLRLEIQTQSFKEINALHEEHSADRATTRKTIARLKQMIVDARTAAQTPAKVKKRRKFVATGQRNGHDTMVKADGTLLIQCKDCGGVYSKSYMVKHWKPKSGGCQAKT